MPQKSERKGSKCDTNERDKHEKLTSEGIMITYFNRLRALVKIFVLEMKLEEQMDDNW